MKHVKPDDNSKSEKLKKDELGNIGEEDEDREEDEEEQNQSKEIDENANFVDEKENIPKNNVNEVLQRQPLSGGNSKIKLKRTTTKRPSTKKLVDEAIKQLNERSGSSTEAIRKCIKSKYPDIIEQRLKIDIRRYVKKCVADGTMQQIKLSFKFTNKHAMKLKQNLRAKKKKDSEKHNIKKEKKKNPKKEKAPEKKSAKKKKSTEKPEDTSKATKRPKGANTKAKAEPVKISKLKKVAKSTKPTETKNSEKLKTKTKARNSINLVVRPTPFHPKIIKNTKITAKASKGKIYAPAAKAEPVASTSAAVQATGRGKRNK